MLAENLFLIYLSIVFFSLTERFTDCLKLFGTFLSKLQPCALPHHFLRFTQGLWRHLVNGTTTNAASSREVHCSWLPRQQFSRFPLVLLSMQYTHTRTHTVNTGATEPTWEVETLVHGIEFDDLQAIWTEQINKTKQHIQCPGAYHYVPDMAIRWAWDVYMCPIFYGLQQHNDWPAQPEKSGRAECVK